MRPIFVKEWLLNFPVFDGQPSVSDEFTAHTRFGKATGLGHSALFRIDHKPLPLNPDTLCAGGDRDLLAHYAEKMRFLHRWKGTAVEAISASGRTDNAS